MTSPFSITPSPSSAQILASLLGDTTGLSNIQIVVTGNPLAVGLFQDSPLSLSGGVVLSTGKVSDLVGSNTTDANNISTDFGGSVTVTGGQDAITLDITFDVDGMDRFLYFLYAFGSEVFLDGIAGGFKDIFTLELNEVNLAFLRDEVTPATISNLAPPDALTNPALFSSDYISNLADTDPGFSSTKLDGYTTPLIFKGALIPKTNNKLKITIQDIGNGSIDSALFLTTGTLGVNSLVTAVSLSASANRVNEDGVDYLVYTFTRNYSKDSLQINYLFGGDAEPNIDYALADGTTIDTTNTQNARFEVGDTTTTVKIAVKSDSLAESDETISLQLVSPLEPKYRILTPDPVVVTILDQDTAVNTIGVSVTPASVAENDLPSGNLIYTFTRTGPVDEALRVDYSVGGTADFGPDYTAIGTTTTFRAGVGTVTFAIGESKAIVSIDPKIDLTPEPDETVILTLQPSGYDTLAGGSGGRIYKIDPVAGASTGTITDPPTITVKLLGPVAVNEDGTTRLAYEFTRTGTVSSTLSVSYEILGATIPVPGEATIGDDYLLDFSSIASSTGTIVFEVGSETAIVFVDPSPDVLVEGDETVSLKLLPAGNSEYIVGTSAPVIGTILDQDTQLNSISLAVSPSIVTEDDSTANLVYTFTRTGPTNESLRVDYNVGGTASLPVDYDAIGASNFQSTQGSVVFAKDAKTAEVTINPRPDLTQEGLGETVELTLVEGRDDSLAGGRSRKYGIDTPGAVTGTISERLSVINVALTTASVNEDGTENLVYTFNRTTTIYQLQAPLTVFYSYGGTATLGDDYSVAPPATLGSITFNPGSPTATLTIDPTPDSIEEKGGETFELTLQPPPTNSSALYIVGTTDAVIGTIADATVGLTLAPVAVLENGSIGLVYTFTRAGSRTQELIVKFSITGSATFNTDYSQVGADTFDGTTGTIVFAANSATDTATVILTPKTDSVPLELDETVTLQLSPASTYAISTPAPVTGTIVEPALAITPLVTVALSPTSVNEDGIANLVYTFTRTGLTERTLLVFYSYGGTAELDVDYKLIGNSPLGIGTIAFAIGASTATLTVDPTPDSIIETAKDDETFSLTLFRPTGSNVSYTTVGIPTAIVGTIVDTTPRIDLSVSPAEVKENGNIGLVYTFTRSIVTDQPLIVNFSIAGDAKLSDDDYDQAGATTFAGTSGTVTFAKNSATAIVTITPKTDVLLEPDETVSLKLSPATGTQYYAVGTSAAVTGTILELNRISLSVAPASVIEDGATNLVYTFTRTGAIDKALRVDYGVGGTADLVSDYDQTGANTFGLKFGTVNFAAGSNQATVTIDPKADNTFEQAETVQLTLAPSGSDTLAGLPNDRGYIIDTIDAIIGTITDATPTVSIALAPTTVNENGTTSLVYTFTRTGSTSTLLEASYKVSGTATYSDDYTQTGAANFASTLGTVVFAENSSTAKITITPKADTNSEFDETVILTLDDGRSNTVPYQINALNTASGTIIEPISVVLPIISIDLIKPVIIDEGSQQNLNYLFTRTGPITQALKVKYSVGGIAKFSTDYNQTGATDFSEAAGSITFAAGSAEASLVIASIADAEKEINEDVSIDLIADPNYIVGLKKNAVGTIADTTPRIDLSVSPTEVKENGNIGLVYTFTRSVVTNQPLIVNFNTAGSATFDSNDYSQVGATTFTGTSGTVTFAANSATTTVTLTPTADASPETDETVTIQLAPATGNQYYAVGTQTAVTGTILELNRISLAVTPASVIEDGTNNLVYTFTRTGPIDKALRVDYSVAGAATLGSDYDQIGANTFRSNIGTVNFAAGSDKATVTIDPKADNTFEQAETVQLTLAPSGSDTLAGLPNDRGYIIDTIDAIIGTITDATPTVSVALSPTTVNEDGIASLIYTFTRTGSTSALLTASYKVSGTATFNDDYTQTGTTDFTNTTGTVVFAENSNTAKITITPKADTNLELNETVILTLDDGISKTVPYQINALNTASGTIIEPNPVALPIINIDLIKPIIIDEGSQQSLNYLFTRTGSTTQALTVNYSVGGIAKFSTDYNQTGTTDFSNTSGSITFAAGSAEASLVITSIADAEIEQNEEVLIDLKAGSNYVLGSRKSAVGTIVDTTPRIDLSVSPTEVKENGGIGLVYTFARSVVTNQPLTVNFNIAGSATFDSNDYSQVGATTFTGTSGTVTFAANSATAIVTITPKADVLLEPDETVTLQLSPATGTQYYAVGTQAAVTGTILELNRISLSVAPASVIEDGATNLVYTFTRTGPIDKALRVDYSVGGAATFISDYDQTGANTFATFGTVNFAAGSSQATVTINPKADNTFEQAETVQLTLAPSGSDTLAGLPNDRGYIIDTTDAIIGTITDATPTVSIALAPTTVNEDGTTSLVYTFTRTGSTSTLLEASYKVSGTATYSDDYTQTGAANFASTLGTVVFAENSSTAKITITPKADTNSEPDETVILTLDNGTSKTVPYQINALNTASGTIIEPIPVVLPIINIDLIKPIIIDEGSQQNLNYLFTRTGSITQALKVEYSVGGIAKFSTDYNQTGATDFSEAAGSITFAAGSAEASLVITSIADAEEEINEDVSIDLIADSTYVLGSSKNAVGTIVDTTPRIDLSLSPTEVKENGNIGLVYTFTRSIVTDQPLTVNFNIAGDAILDDDYSQAGATFTGKSGTVDFAPKASTATVTVTPKIDSLLEKTETVDLKLSAAISGQYYAIGTPATITGSILDSPIVVQNLPPTAIVFNDSVSNNSFSIAENTSTANRIKIASIKIVDDQLGTNTLSLSGTDASSFELDGTSLYLKPGIVLDYETRTNYKLAVTVDDITVGSTPDVANNFTLIVTDVNEPPTGAPIFIFSDILENTSRLISVTSLLAGFSDVERDVLSVIDLRATNGTITKNSNGTFNFIPNKDFVGKIDLIYGVSDGVNILPNQTLGFNMLPLSEALNFTGTTNLDVGSINNLASATFAVNPRNINLTGDEINLLGGQDSVSMPGKDILLQSFSPSQNIQIGDSDSGSTSILDLTATDLAAIANGFSKITFGRANGTGNINLNSNISFRDPVLLQSPGGQVNITTAITLIDDATLDFDTQTLVKSGSSTLALIGNKPTTSIGSVIINSGNLALAKAINVDALNNAPIVINSGGLQLGNSDQINDAADLTLNGGTFNLNGFNETLDLLKVTSNSTIDFGNSSSDLAFGDSSTQDWIGLLTIDNWLSTSGETLRFGNSSSALTAAQLSDIQFTGFSRGAKIDAVGFVTPIEITQTVPTGIADQDGISEAIENLAPNNGDGNRDGILDSQQDNVTSILTLGGTITNNVATLVSRPGTKINNLRLLPSPIVTADLTSIANPAEFKITGVGLGQATTVEFLLAKADQNRKYNTYLMSGKTATNPTTHLYEFLFDGQTGAELFDTNSDGFTDKVVVHFIDGQRGDNDLTVNGEIQDPGAPGIADNALSLSKDINNVIQVAGSSGAAVVGFSLVANQSKQVNEVGFFKIDANNKVNGIAANANGFAQAALQSGEVVFSALGDNLLNTTDISRQLQLNAGDRLGFYLVQNGTVDAALRKNDFSNVVFSTDQANPNSKNYLQVNPLTGSGYQLKWTGANNDLTLNLQLQDAPLNNQNLIASSQGERESELLDLRSFTGQNVQVNFTLKREAAYNNTVGFYKVEDAQGTVMSITGAKLKPGEAGYAAAVVQNKITGVDLSATNGQTISIDKTLAGGAIYAPFLISNGDVNSLNGNFSNVLTPYLLGNSDGVDHVRLLGDNTFGFEDLVGGGDQDFNDVILKAVFKTT
jgi:hypothetical protein